MAGSDLPRSPFAGLVGSSASSGPRLLSHHQIEEMLAAHRLYVETERRRGRRADFGSADLAGLNFSGLNLRRAKMDRALLKGADLDHWRRRRRRHNHRGWRIIAGIVVDVWPMMPAPLPLPPLMLSPLVAPPTIAVPIIVGKRRVQRRTNRNCAHDPRCQQRA